MSRLASAVAASKVAPSPLGKPEKSASLRFWPALAKEGHYTIKMVRVSPYSKHFSSTLFHDDLVTLATVPLALKDECANYL